MPDPMPSPPSPPTRQYVIAGKVQYHGADVSGANIAINDETHAGSRSFTSSESDSNFAETMANVSDDWADSDVVLIAATHNGRRAQKKITINETANPGQEDIGAVKLLAHWGCCQ
jgi:hypothetical protein